MRGKWWRVVGTTIGMEVVDNETIITYPWYIMIHDAKESLNHDVGSINRQTGE